MYSLYAFKFLIVQITLQVLSFSLIQKSSRYMFSPAISLHRIHTAVFMCNLAFLYFYVVMNLQWHEIKDNLLCRLLLGLPHSFSLLMMQNYSLRLIGDIWRSNSVWMPDFLVHQLDFFGEAEGNWKRMKVGSSFSNVDVSLFGACPHSANSKETLSVGWKKRKTEAGTKKLI